MYRNINIVNSDDEGIEQVDDINISDDTDTSNSNNINNDDENSNNKKESSKESITSEETQLAGMLTVVWSLFVIGIIIFIAGSIVKSKNNTSVKTEYLDVASNMYSMSSLSAEEKNWIDRLVVEKKVQCNGNTVSFYLVGLAETYGKVVYIPVTNDEFNSVNNGDVVEFVFSRLNIQSKENIIIRRWNLV